MSNVSVGKNKDQHGFFHDFFHVVLLMRIKSKDICQMNDDAVRKAAVYVAMIENVWFEFKYKTIMPRS